MTEYIIKRITNDFYELTKIYKVDLALKTCTCKGFKFNKKCKHFAMCQIREGDVYENSRNVEQTVEREL